MSVVHNIKEVNVKNFLRNEETELVCE